MGGGLQSEGFRPTLLTPVHIFRRSSLFPLPNNHVTDKLDPDFLSLYWGRVLVLHHRGDMGLRRVVARGHLVQLPHHVCRGLHADQNLRVEDGMTVPPAYMFHVCC